MSAHSRTFALLICGALVGTACGLKPDVKVASGTGDGLTAEAPQDGGNSDADVFTLDPSSTDDGSDVSTDPGAGDTSTSTDSTDNPSGVDLGAGTGTSTGEQTPGSGVATGQPAGQQTSNPQPQQTSGTQSPSPQATQTQGSQTRQPVGSDRTGVTSTSISLAIHAPITGAAPLPSTSFEKARSLYWDHVTGQGKKILGRTNIAVSFRDDRYDPASAQQVCRELAATNFAVVGGGGTDQIQTCGRFAEVAQFPYFSAGVTESGLQSNPWYFAASMSYKDQARLLARYAAKNFPGEKVTAVITDTPNFDDAVAGWEAGLRDAGLTGNAVATRRHPRNDTSWYGSFVQDLSTKDVGVVFILTSPLDYIRFAQKGQENGWEPQWVGVGISMGLNAVLANGCPAVDDGVFFSPFPGLDYARKNIPEFFQAAAKYGTPNDDISLALWGIAKQQHQMFDAYEKLFGTDLTREGFRAVVETLTLETGVFPRVSYTPKDHFGGEAVHVLRANCATSEYETLATFASSF